MELRDYQIQAIHDLRASIREGNRSPLLVLSTGAGKTLVSVKILEMAIEKGNRTLFLAPRRELVYQTGKSLESIGFNNYGLIMAGEETNPEAPVQIASVSTIHRRYLINKNPLRPPPPLPPAQIIVIDEIHVNMSAMMKKILANYPDSIRISLTATPVRSDGRGLGEICDDLITGPSMKELTAMGHLLPVRYFAPSKPDLEKVRTMAGDYREDDLEKVMNQKKLVGDVVENWLRICPDRQTVVFAVNRAHAMSLYKEFVRIGISTAYLDGNTPNEERAEIIKQLETGDVQVVCSVEVLSFGWDAPVVSCGIIARPTKSLARYLQSAGRILRPYPSQKDAILIDHGGVVDELGFLEDDQPWSLDGKEKIQDRKKQKEKTEPKPIECYQCKSLIRPQKECPQCGADLSGQASKAIEAHEAELQEIFREEQAKEHAKRSREWSMEAKADFYAQLRWICQERGYNSGWAANQYRKKIGTWPNKVGKPEPKKPTKETFAWVRHQQIKYAKAREKANL